MINFGIKTLDEKVKINENDIIVIAGEEIKDRQFIIDQMISKTQETVLLFSFNRNHNLVLDDLRYMNSYKYTSQLIIEDKTEMTIDEIIYKIKDYQRYNISCVFIDYIQLVKDYNRTKEEISMKIYTLSKEINIPIIIISELWKEQTKYMEVYMPEAKEINNKSLVDIARITLLVFRDDENDKKGNKNILKIVISKNNIGNIDISAIYKPI